MGWKTMSQENKQYRAKLTGTEDQWSKRIEDIVARGHEIIKQGSFPHQGYHYSTEQTMVYWADVRIPG